jgi:hypothetical protein
MSPKILVKYLKYWLEEMYWQAYRIYLLTLLYLMGEL